MVAHTPHTPAQAPVHPSGRCGSSPPAAQRSRGRDLKAAGGGRAAAAPPHRRGGRRPINGRAFLVAARAARLAAPRLFRATIAL